MVTKIKWSRGTKDTLKGKNLMKIKETGTAPINLIRYQKMGLIKKRVYKTSKGQLKDVKLSLTDKGKRILNARL